MAKKSADAIKAAKDHWDQKFLRKDFKRLPERLPAFTSMSGFPIE